MSEVRFEVADVAEIRFCVSPLWETVASLWAFGQPARHALHLPWTKEARLLARRRDLAGHVRLLAAFARPRSWLPDFLTPPPGSPLIGIGEELANVRATPGAEVRRDVLITAESRPLDPLAQRLADEPETMLPLVVDAARAWHDAAIAPHWPRMRALLEADIAYRARQLAGGGARLLFDTLHPAARWDGDRLVIADRWTQSLSVSGRGFPLMPSVFADKAPLISCSDESAPGAVYPARAVGTLWEGGRVAGERGAALGAVLGAARARLLELLRAPGTTSDLAHRTGLSLGAVSQQLGLLHDARLINRNRQGRAVYYLCTDLGLALLDGGSGDGSGNGGNGGSGDGSGNGGSGHGGVNGGNGGSGHGGGNGGNGGNGHGGKNGAGGESGGNGESDDRHATAGSRTVANGTKLQQGGDF